MLGLISNGFLLSERRVEELNQTGLTDLQISVDGVEPNDMTLKTLRPLRSKLDALARRARFKVVLCAVVGSGAPFAEVAEVIQFARDHGFRPRILLVHGTDGQLDRRVHDLRSYHRLQRLIGRHYQDLFDYRDALFERGEAPFRCRAGSRYLYVDEGGLVHWCAQTRTGWGKPLAEYTTVDLRRQFYTFKNCNLSCTLGCVRSCSMLDRWFPQERPSVPR
jgi:MoaA/NifB/PqqE/SkfB family radical SAM enzyme